MTRVEIIKLLEYLFAAYPNTKISDPKGTVDIWCLNFSESEADTIYKAARHHMNNSPYFPTIWDIRNSQKYAFKYDHPQEPAAPKIESKKKDDVWKFCDCECKTCKDRDSCPMAIS